jgi:hypothetical protein
MSAGPERKATWVVLVGALALVTGCGSTISCSAVGCASGLSVNALSSVQRQAVRWMRVCVAGTCRTDGVGHYARRGPYSDGSAPTTARQARQPLNVTVTLEAASRAKLLTASGSVRFRQVAPNGIKCGPVCYIAQVTVHPDGTLSATPIRG